jgi:polyisoprenoid-binding protein YceI
VRGYATKRSFDMSTATTANATTWIIDPAHTLAEFSAKHMVITTVKGRFAAVEGAITVNEEDPSRSEARVEIGTASIDTGVEDRDAHLRSGDFLDVEEHPAITFVSRSVEGASLEPGAPFRVTGDLTIRGTTREVVLEVTYEGRGQDPWGGERISFSGETRIDRRDFGLTWNQALEAGGLLVGNEIRIALEVQATRQDS